MLVGFLLFVISIVMRVSARHPVFFYPNFGVKILFSILFLYLLNLRTRRSTYLFKCLELTTVIASLFMF